MKSVVGSFLLSVLLPLGLVAHEATRVEVRSSSNRVETSPVRPQFTQPSSVQRLIDTYSRRGGDISGGGFGLVIRGTQQILLHDLWCENRRYNYTPDAEHRTGALKPVGEVWPLDLESVAARELAIASERVARWRIMAPDLMDRLLANLNQRGSWFGTLQAPNDNVNLQFEFPGTAEEYKQFLLKFEPKQVARVDRFTGKIYIASNLWDRMDLKSRAGLLVHEALRKVYLQTTRGYLSPSILQWMVGAMMFREPGSAAHDQRMFESFYEEMFVNLDRTAYLERNRPASWKAQLCEARHELVREARGLEIRSSLNQNEAANAICQMETRARQIDQAAPRNWINLGTFRQLPSACGAAGDLTKVPTASLTYWMQRSIGIGRLWSSTSQDQKAFRRDLTQILREIPSLQSLEMRDEILRRFERAGRQFCEHGRRDIHGSGADFTGLGDVLIEWMLMPNKFQKN